MKPLLTLLAALALSFGAAQEFPVTVTDFQGNDVTVMDVPKRVFCLLPDCIQHLAVIGVVPAGAMEFDIRSSGAANILGDRASGITPFAWGPDGPDIEAILGFAPDFIVMEPYTAEEPMFDLLEEAIPHYVTAGPYPDLSQLDSADEGDWTTYTRDLMNLATIVGRRDAAAAFVKGLRNRYAAYRELALGDASYMRVRLEEDGTIFAPPCLTFLGGLAECRSLGDDWVEAGVEALLDQDPDVLFVEASPDREIDLEAWNSVPLWADIRAVAEGRVHVVGYGEFYDSTPLVLKNTLDAFMPALYPDIFPEPLTDERVQEILDR